MHGHRHELLLGDREQVLAVEAILLIETPIGRH